MGENSSSDLHHAVSQHCEPARRPTMPRSRQTAVSQSADVAASAAAVPSSLFTQRTAPLSRFDGPGPAAAVTIL